MKSIWNKDKIQNLIDNFSQPYKVISIERRDNSILYAYLKCNICGYKFYRSLERIKLGTICCEKCIKNKNTIKNFSEHEKYLHLTFPKYKLLDIKKEKSKIYYKVECENGHIYWGYRNHLHNGHGCKYCNHKQVKVWNKNKILDLYKKFNLEIINFDEYTNSESVLYAKNDEGYIIKTVPSKLNSLGIQQSYLYNKCNKYAQYNLNHWCKINRPDYECINLITDGKRNKCTFLYKGNYIKDGEDREFQCALKDFISGVEHPSLNMSKGEKYVSSFLKQNNIKFISQYKFSDCFFKNKNAPLRFDFYLPKYNICIEYNGVQHYKKVEIFGGDKAFKEQKKRDKLKREYCKKNNIKLIEIAYNDNIKVSMNNILKVVNNDAYSRGNY